MHESSPFFALLLSQCFEVIQTIEVIQPNDLSLALCVLAQL
jgi:hypothetical protein